ncbi:hypothetical protein GCM10009764_21170 [Nocardia ninae]|uniref:Uncharacterized protein n=1 Tax=Nocardia ninae NBRC 108245 TaxID=1210091 RepID=A0A511MSZ0_9NOCA|nr:hypothetical protein NN4_82210 [Nocardia ninae NBRC 108245]
MRALYPIFRDFDPAWVPGARTRVRAAGRGRFDACAAIMPKRYGSPVVPAKPALPTLAEQTGRARIRCARPALGVNVIFRTNAARGPDLPGMRWLSQC